MPEQVVEPLEPVEVVQDEDVRVRRAAVESPLQVLDEPPAIPELGKWIGDREQLDLARDRSVLPQRRHGSDQHHADCSCGEHERERVDVPEVIDDKDGERQDRADDGRRDQRPPFQRDPSYPPRLNPGRNGEENAHQRPQDVEQRALDVRPGGGRPQVDGVGDRSGDERSADHDPLAPGRDADEPEHTDHESEQDDVAERIREIRRDREKTALAVVEGQLEKERCADRTDGQRHADTVEPDAPVEV